MNNIVLYDSQFGNTAIIAEVVADALRGLGSVRLLKPEDAKIDLLRGVDVFVVGSPTQKFRPTPGISNFLGSIPKNGLSGIKVAAFDTRFTDAEINKTPPLPIFVKMFGFAAGSIAKQLKAKGGQLVTLPEGFYVNGMEGPLVEGELERARRWTEGLFA